MRMRLSIVASSKARASSIDDSLPDTVDSEKVNATGKDGVPMVTIPKQAKAMPRRLQTGG